jgi:osmotically-inducible protein OsmY
MRPAAERSAVYGFVAAVLLGAGLAYFLDPDRGRARRAVTRDRIAGAMRRGAARTARTGRRIGSGAEGMSQRLAHAGADEGRMLDDATLAQKVMSEVFRSRDIPKGAVNVNVENGVVYLRGEVEDPRMIERIVERTRDVGGVFDIENLLHLPGDPAPRA